MGGGSGWSYLLTNCRRSVAALRTKRSGKIATFTNHSHQLCCCWATTGPAPDLTTVGRGGEAGEVDP